MSFQVKCSAQNTFVESTDELLKVLRGFSGNHLSVIETLPSGIKKPHFLSINENGDPFYTYQDNQPFTTSALHSQG